MTQWFDWIGKNSTVEDVIAPAPADRLGATLDSRNRFRIGDKLPPVWHWLYFIEPTTASETAEDGHPRKGGFLPPIELPRRMWAGGRLEFIAPVRMGDVLRRSSEIVSIDEKSGRTGTLIFVIVRHTIMKDTVTLIREEQDIVYREAPPPKRRNRNPSQLRDPRHGVGELRRIQCCCFVTLR